MGVRKKTKVGQQRFDHWRSALGLTESHRVFENTCVFDSSFVSDNLATVFVIAIDFYGGVALELALHSFDVSCCSLLQFDGAKLLEFGVFVCALAFCS